MRIVKIVIIVALLTVSFSMTYYSFNKSINAKDALEKERYLRMVAEENLEINKKQVALLQDKINKYELKIEELQTRVDQADTVKSELETRLKEQQKENDTLQKQIADLRDKVAGLQEGPAMPVAQE